MRVIPPPNSSDATRTVLLDCLLKWGRSAGQLQALTDDPWTIVWHSDGGFTAALVGVRTVVVWRGPVCPPESLSTALRELFGWARETRRQLVVLGAPMDVTAAGRHIGMRSFWIGTECWTDLATWSEFGPRRRKLRWARNHARPTHRWVEVFPRADAEVRHELTAIQDAWMQDRPARQTHSFLRTDWAENITHRRYFACQEDVTGHLVASVVATRINRSDWYIQDCVRKPDSPRGSLEGAIVCALDHLRDDGYRRASNGILPMWEPPSQIDAHGARIQLGPIGRLLVAYFDRTYRFSGLNQFRTKLDADQFESVAALYGPYRFSPLSGIELGRTLR